MFVKNNPRKALRFYNQGIKLLPNEETLIAVRGLCKYKMDDKSGAQTDWNRFKVLASIENSKLDFENLAQDLIVSESYSEIINILEK